MSSLTDIAEKHAHMLGELAEFGLNLARKLHDQAMAAEEPAVVADLAKAFHAVSRTLRQTMLLETRVAREAAGLVNEARKAAELRIENAVGHRVKCVSQALDHAINDEYEDETESQNVYEDAMERLYEDSLAPDFLDQSMDDQIARLCKDLGLQLPPVEQAATRDPEAPPERVPYALDDWADPDEARHDPLNPAPP